MAKHSSHILDMARKGAEHKYEELMAEMRQLVAHFPHLAARTGRQVSRAASKAFARGRRVVGAAIAGESPKTRRKMSAKARKAIGDAQRKRWATKKSADAAGTKKMKK
jgi:hypothetical protein